MAEYDRHPRIGGFGVRYKFGGGPGAPEPTPPPPTELDPAVVLAKSDFRERQRRLRGRAASGQSTPGGLRASRETTEILNLSLQDTLGLRAR